MRRRRGLERAKESAEEEQRTVDTSVTAGTAVSVCTGSGLPIVSHMLPGSLWRFSLPLLPLASSPQIHPLFGFFFF